MKKVLIITGGSGGIGKATALLFFERGYSVYELSRHGKSENGITHIDADVTDSEQLAGAVKQVIEKEGRVDVLICNAGYGISGAVEFTDISDAQRQFDVNVLGMVRTVQAVLPYMRQQKAGKILVTSSVAAVLPIPYQAFYSASKAAINAIVCSLRNEVKDFNIQVSALMPGDVKTGFTNARKKAEHGAEVYTNMQRAVETMEKDEQNGLSCEYVAECFWQIAQKSNPKPLYTTALQYRLFVYLEKHLSKRFSNWVVGKIY